MKRSNRWRLDTKRRQSSLNSINRTIAQWTSSSRFLFHLYLDFRRFLSTIFLLVALDWSVDRIAFATRSTWISHMSYCLYWLQETWFVGIVWVTISFFAFGFCHVPLSILAAKWNDAIAIASSWFFFFFFDGHKNVVRLHLSSANDRHRIVIGSTYCHIALIVRRWNASVQRLCECFRSHRFWLYDVSLLRIRTSPFSSPRNHWAIERNKEIKIWENMTYDR